MQQPRYSSATGAPMRRTLYKTLHSMRAAQELTQFRACFAPLRGRRRRDAWAQPRLRYRRVASGRAWRRKWSIVRHD